MLFPERLPYPYAGNTRRKSDCACFKLYGAARNPSSASLSGASSIGYCSIWLLEARSHKLVSYVGGPAPAVGRGSRVESRTTIIQMTGTRLFNLLPWPHSLESPHRLHGSGSNRRLFDQSAIQYLCRCP